jgi:hypothetical protein
MKDLRKLHHRAMELAEKAFVLRRQSKGDEARALSYQAFLLEKQAAENAQTEPTRSVFYRSAATLVRDCGEYREAERLIAAALCGDPPEAIADELRQLLNEVYTAWGVHPQAVV